MTPGRHFVAERSVEDLLKSRRLSLTSATFCFLLASCFVPVSWKTPIGFLSVCDLTLALATVQSVAFMLWRGRLQPFDFRVVLLALLAFCLVAGAQLRAEPSDLSPTLKYFVFLVIVPVYVLSAGTKSIGRTRVSDLCGAISGAALLLCCLALMQIATGATASGSEGTHYLVLWGQVVNKNAVGTLALFGAIAAAWLVFVLGRRIHLASLAIIIATTLIMGARTAFFVELLMVSVVYVAVPRLNVMRLIGLTAIALPIVGGALAMAPYVPQLRRLSEFLPATEAMVGSGAARIVLWDYAIDRIAISPWLGFGYDTFNYPGETWFIGMVEPHNNLLQIAYSGGWVGVAGFGLLLWTGCGKRCPVAWAALCRVLLFAYLLVTAGDIIWLRASGHLFWLLFFAAALPDGSLMQSPIRRPDTAGHPRCQSSLPEADNQTGSTTGQGLVRCGGRIGVRQADLGIGMKAERRVRGN